MQSHDQIKASQLFVGLDDQQSETLQGGYTMTMVTLAPLTTTSYWALVSKLSGLAAKLKAYKAPV